MHPQDCGLDVVDSGADSRLRAEKAWSESAASITFIRAGRSGVFVRWSRKASCVTRSVDPCDCADMAPALSALTWAGNGPPATAAIPSFTKTRRDIEGKGKEASFGGFRSTSFPSPTLSKSRSSSLSLDQLKSQALGRAACLHELRQRDGDRHKTGTS